MEALYNKASFIKSAETFGQLPEDVGVEVAFIGRSNAGKSSAINTITNIKNLARTSKTPGRTQLINLFALDETRRLVDLPGYGYAKVPLSVQERWQKTVNQYLLERKSLKGLVVVMDVRHPLKDSDRQLIDWAVACKLPLHILLTKSDKLKRNPAKQVLHDVINDMVEHQDLISVQLFSSHDRVGLDEARDKLDGWLS